jgi:hypothetical protein
MSLLLRYDLPRAGSPTCTMAGSARGRRRRRRGTDHREHDLRLRVVRLRDCAVDQHTRTSTSTTRTLAADADDRARRPARGDRARAVEDAARRRALAVELLQPVRVSAALRVHAGARIHGPDRAERRRRRARGRARRRGRGRRAAAQELVHRRRAARRARDLRGRDDRRRLRGRVVGRGHRQESAGCPARAPRSLLFTAMSDVRRALYARGSAR